MKRTRRICVVSEVKAVRFINHGATLLNGRSNW